MADRKITELSAMSAGSQATGDLLTIVDVSEAAAADKNKKMTMENLFKGIPGDVGIGTSSPTEKLSVNGKMHITNDIVLAQTNPKFDFDNGNSNGALRFHSTSANAERMRIDSSGNVGIGTSSPSSKLDVNGSVRFGDGGGFDMNINGTRHQFSIGSSEKMRIDSSSGTVSIGTTTGSGFGELLKVNKAASGTNGAGIRLSGGASVGDDQTQTFSVGNACLVFIAENNTGDGALFFCGFKSSTVTLLSDPNNRYANSDTDGKICVFKSADTSTVTLKNRVGSSKSFTVGKINCID
tara:strand:+ start:3658 stop:4542 length:885 start_codon:yes stop_codon:yes gene_type:complete